ncbi:hypothetical protein FLT15_31735 [Paenibacillus thiaminolyticus]|uniref:putative metallopeptidase n=1 Tax=Paenibacillus thiaminolyticus TaxID=49283 RepID=UPI00116423C9|nr:putative metallopeptidase [Paenibacillus thiaminolyticus]NGP62683.1 hypothetical protein [Paenibacillus thiaminolyticus]NGP62739.1 hypothetical protein [Paenibacillus thiaminolyticus]
MAASFQDSPDVEQLVKKLIEKNKEFKHLQGAKIIGRFRFGTWNSKGKVTLGQAKVLTPFERHEIDAELAVIVNGEVWEHLDNKQREALVYHELCHFEEMTDANGSPKMDDNKRPMFKIAGHDLEEFSSVVRKYGLWMPDTRKFVQAAKEGEQLEIDFEKPTLHAVGE